ncbi:MAG: hypothetical protein ABW178_00925 [Pseudoxanthomonas sp.]
MITPSLQMLYSELDALSGAVEQGRHEDALQLMSTYDRDLRTFMATDNGGTALDPLRGLLTQQNTILERMRQCRDEAATRLRQLRQSNTAARAYRAMP